MIKSVNFEEFWFLGQKVVKAEKIVAPFRGISLSWFAALHTATRFRGAPGAFSRGAKFSGQITAAEVSDL